MIERPLPRCRLAALRQRAVRQQLFVRILRFRVGIALPVTRAWRERVPCSATVLGDVCERGFLVEDFGLSLNLMLACAATIVQGGPLACLRAISVAYEGGTTAPSSWRQDGGSEIRQV
jgi:hypothetical protein